MINVISARGIVGTLVRVALYVVLGVTLGLVLRAYDMPEWIVDGAQLGLAIVLVGMVVINRARDRRYSHKGDGQCAFCGRPATSAVQRYSGGRRPSVSVRHCDAHLGEATARLKR